MNAKEARRLSNKNGFEKKLQKEIESVERSIQRACENGRTSTCVFNCDADKSDVEIEAKKHFQKLGYTFKPTGYNGGVWQRTENICW